MLPAWLRDFARSARDLVYPPACLLCDADVPEPPFCEPCFAALTTDPFPACVRCSSTVGPHVDTTVGCAKCRNESFRFAGACRLGVYDAVLREAVLRAKSLSGELLAEALGMLLARKLPSTYTAGVVVPVPLHWRKRLARGYNQSAAAAFGLAEVLKLPCRPRWLTRTRDTPAQTSQSASARRDNVRGAFRAKRVSGMRVLLVDDVLTTGATADAAAVALRAAGAAQVWVAVLSHR